MKKVENSRWKVTDNRFVVFLDILGFKDLVMRSSHAEIYKLLNYITDKKKIIEEVKDADELEKSDIEFFSVTFSDSIVIFSKNDSFLHFDIISSITGYFFSKLIEKSIPIKGAIAHGVISINKSSQIFFGQPIIDAYLLEEDLNYMGIVAHNSIDEYISKIASKESKLIADFNFLDVPTPFKFGKLSHLNLDWFRHMPDSYSDYLKDMKYSEFIISIIRKFKNQVSGSSRKYVDNTIQVIEEVLKYPNNGFSQNGG
jgi:hypothetical protein